MHRRATLQTILLIPAKWFAALLLLLALPAAADLVWESKSKHRSACERAYREFPQRGKEQPVYVRVVSWDEFQAMGAPKWAIGWYQDAGPRLWLATETRRQTVWTCAHEYGHWFYYRVLTPEERADWERYWKASRQILPTDYARTRPEEGFAETFEWRFTHGREALPKPLRRQLRRYFRPEIR